MELRRYEDGKDKVDASVELVRKTKLYMESHPDVDYTTASNAVLQADPELARNYAGNTGSYDAEKKENFYVPAKPKEMTEYQQGLEASKEIARLSEIEMLERDLSYMDAQALILKKNPELLRQYCLEICD